MNARQQNLSTTKKTKRIKLCSEKMNRLYCRIYRSSFSFSEQKLLHTYQTKIITKRTRHLNYLYLLNDIEIVVSRSTNICFVNPANYSTHKPEVKIIIFSFRSLKFIAVVVGTYYFIEAGSTIGFSIFYYRSSDPQRLHVVIYKYTILENRDAFPLKLFVIFYKRSRRLAQVIFKFGRTSTIKQKRARARVHVKPIDLSSSYIPLPAISFEVIIMRRINGSHKLPVRRRPHTI